MANWKRSPLGAVADLCLGKMLDQDKNRGEPLPYLANVNVRWGEFALDKLRTMRFEPHERDRYGLKLGDIVMCEGGEPGRCAIWMEQVPGMMIQKALHRIRPHDVLDYRFLYYELLNIGYCKGFDQYFTGATIKHLPGEKLAKVEIDIPPLPIQRRIAGILSAYDELIENSQRRIKILESMARALYREWFVHFRFPGHESVPRVPSSLGDIPKGWEVKKIAEFADFTRGFEPGSDSYKKKSGIGLMKFLRVGDLSKRDSGLFIDEQLVQGRVLKPLDIAITLDGSVGEVRLGLDGAYSSGIRRVDVKDRSRLGWVFTYQLLLSDASQATIQAHAKGTTIKHAGSAVAALEFVSAPEIMIKKFETTAAPMLWQVLTLQEQVETLRRTRDLLLPRLLSGQIDVEALNHA